MHAVVPRTDCPHVHNIDFFSVSLNEARNITSSPCRCGENFENWICLVCSAVECSRYKNGHMKDHNEETKHAIALSMADFSVWCYDCNDYIDSPEVKSLHDTLYLAKFNEAPQKYEDSPIVLEDKVNQLANLIEASSKIVSFTGLGIITPAIKPEELSTETKQPGNLFSPQEAESTVKIQEMKPTLTHMALAELSNSKDLYVISNYSDNLHTKSGLKEESYKRVDISKGTLPPDELEHLVSKFSKADLTLVLGSGMRFNPADKIPSIVKQNGGKLVIINPTDTDFDQLCDVRIWGQTDKVFDMLFKKLNLNLLEYEA